jgi:predicted nuclease of predicted toxin-antitoxin system
MLVKLDENLSNSHVIFLQEVGYECDRVTDEGLSGEDDQVIWQQVCQEGRFLITLDLDFSDIRLFPPGSHPGILLLRPQKLSRQSVLELLAKIISEHPLETLKGCLVVADEQKTRIRRPVR